MIFGKKSVRNGSPYIQEGIRGVNPKAGTHRPQGRHLPTPPAPPPPPYPLARKN